MANDRVGDYIKNDIGRVIYEAVRCFELAGLRVTRVQVPLKFWHDWTYPSPRFVPPRTVSIDGNPVDLVAPNPLNSPSPMKLAYNVRARRMTAVLDAGTEAAHNEGVSSTAPPAAPDVLSRDVVRSRRKHPTRARTLNQRTTQSALAEMQLARTLEELRVPVARDMPKTRGVCDGGQRPCPYVSCRYNLYLDVNARNGSVKLNFPDVEPEHMVESCVLDVADRGGTTLEDVGAIMNVTRERVRQLEVMAMQKLETSYELAALGEDLLDSGNSDSGLELRAVLRRGPA